MPRAIISAIDERFLYPGIDVSITCESFDNSYNISGPAGFSINQSITIYSLNFSVEGEYNCTTSNECGKDVDRLTLEMKSKLCMCHMT